MLRVPKEFPLLLLPHDHLLGCPAAQRRFSLYSVSAAVDLRSRMQMVLTKRRKSCLSSAVPAKCGSSAQGAPELRGFVF